MGTRKKSTEHMEYLDMNELEEDCFTEGDISGGKTVATFSFGVSTPEPLPILTKPAYRTTPKGLTPAVDGELYTMKRCYQFRQSTIRKLNELKANHEDVNAYLNTIIDQAILHYYDYVFNSKSN